MSWATDFAFDLARAVFLLFAAALRTFRMLLGALLRNFGESRTNTKVSMQKMSYSRTCNDHIPPMGRSVYEIYGKSESEQTLIGGDTGLEPALDVGVVGASSSGVDRRRPVTAIVLPRCKRPAAGADAAAC